MILFFFFFFHFRSLGLKSPFIEFRLETEVLSNTSIALNTTSDENLRKKYGSVDDYPSGGGFKNNQTIFYLTEDSPYNKFNVNQIMGQNKFEQTSTQSTTTSTTTLLPISPQINSRRSSYNHEKQIEILEERIEEEIVELEDRRDRKYIVPLALKNPTEEPKRSPLFQESTPNIEDLKKHILMLQNLTKNDKNFQSKFVVFPNLQKNQTQTSIISEPSKPRSTLNTPIQMALQSKNILRDSYDSIPPTEKITIIPQVILQNDQTPMTPEDYEMMNRKNKESGVRVTYSGRLNNRRNGQKKRKQLDKFTTTTTTTTSTTTTTTPRPKTSTPTPKQKRKKQRNMEKVCARNPNKKKCQNLLTTPPTTNSSYQKIQQNPSFNASNSSPSSSLSLIPSPTSSSSSAILQRSSRSNREQKNRYPASYLFSPPPTHQTSSTASSTGNNDTNTGAYKENIDLNPDLCWKVKGLSHGQQKICASHTHIMPSISRGARSAIQVCFNFCHFFHEFSFSIHFTIVHLFFANKKKIKQTRYYTNNLNEMDPARNYKT